MIYFGVLVYQNPSYKYTSSNIGDYIQTLAALNIYRAYVDRFYNTNTEIEEFVKNVINNSYSDFQFIFLKRDNLNNAEYCDKKIVTIMNGWFLHPVDDTGQVIDWPPGPHIIPIFTSFHIANKSALLSDVSIDYFKSHEPIGCRDLDTHGALEKLGVKCYFSGCLTTTIDFYTHIPKDKTFVVDVENGEQVNTNDKVVVVQHCKSEYKTNSIQTNLKIALNLLKDYSEAKNIITSRIHCYLPCNAMGVPVTIHHPQSKHTNSWGPPNRFKGLIFDKKPSVLCKDFMLKLLHERIEKFNSNTTVKTNIESTGEIKVEALSLQSDLHVPTLVRKNSARIHQTADGAVKTIHVKIRSSRFPTRLTQRRRPTSQTKVKKSPVTFIVNEESSSSDDDLEECIEEEIFDGTIDLVFCTDKNYLILLPTVVNSIYQNQPKSQIICIHLIVDFDPCELLEKHVEYVESTYGYKIKLYHLTNMKFNYSTNLNHVSDATMLRLLIPDIIPTTVSKILYLDLDIIVNANLNRIFKLDMKENAIIAKSSLYKKVLHGMTNYTVDFSLEKSFNAGILLLDLEKLRKDNFTAKCFTLLKENPFNDQVILNLYCNGVYGELPANFNVFNRQDDKILLKSHPSNFILHFVGSQKPWLSNEQTVDNRRIWKKYEIFI